MLAWCKTFDTAVEKNQSHAAAAVGGPVSVERASGPTITEPEASDQLEHQEPANVAADSQQIQYQEVFQTSDPALGWTFKSAQHWVQELEQHFGSVGCVRIIPTQCAVPEQRYGVIRCRTGYRGGTRISHVCSGA